MDLQVLRLSIVELLIVSMHVWNSILHHLAISPSNLYRRFWNKSKLDLPTKSTKVAFNKPSSFKTVSSLTEKSFHTLHVFVVEAILSFHEKLSQAFLPHWIYPMMVMIRESLWILQLLQLNIPKMLSNLLRLCSTAF